jgi:hypothetical protein
LDYWIAISHLYYFDLVVLCFFCKCHVISLVGLSTR